MFKLVTSGQRSLECVDLILGGPTWLIGLAVTFHLPEYKGQSCQQANKVSEMHISELFFSQLSRSQWGWFYLSASFKIESKNDLMQWNRCSGIQILEILVWANYRWVIFISEVRAGHNKGFHLLFVPKWNQLKKQKQGCSIVYPATFLTLNFFTVIGSHY